MNTSRVIEVTVSATGDTTVQTKGFTGSACRDASRLLEQALGVVLSDQPTSEMYQAQSVPQSLRQDNR